MIFHPEDYNRAVVYWSNRQFPRLTADQHKQVQDWGRLMIRFHLRHPILHHAINVSVFILLFTLDWFVLMRLGRHIASPVAAGIVIGLAHGYLMYSLAGYTLHEGAAHKLIILRKGALSRLAASFVGNLSRITTSDPGYYASSHMAHHAHFTTPKDEEFLNFVSRKRFLGAFFPYALVLNINDFRAHAGMKFTKSRAVSLAVTFAYHGIFAFFMFREYPAVTVIVALAVVFPHCAFWLDRFRQYMEHNLMPLDTVNGARDLGVGPWGMLIGGGPWGQPCHWSHHLFPGIPWYQQIRMHNKLRSLLTPEQRSVFFYRPIVGFPLALARVMRETA